jgi:hypothetical protein
MNKELLTKEELNECGGYLKKNFYCSGMSFYE